MSLAVGQVFAGYRILRVLGAGAMGTVYLAAHPRLPREDALKVLPPDLTANPEYRARFVPVDEHAASIIAASATRPEICFTNASFPRSRQVCRGHLGEFLIPQRSAMVGAVREFRAIAPV